MPTTDPTAADFLAAILADPADDTPRLIYADWLEEHGDAAGRAQAELIRVQCRIAHLESKEGGSHVAHPEAERNCVARALVSALHSCERKLLLAHGFGWLPRIGIKPILHDGGESEGVNFEIVTGTEQGSGIQMNFARGFPASIALPLAAFQAHAAAIFASQPVTAVRLSDREPYNNVANHWVWDNEQMTLANPQGLSNLPADLLLLLDGDEDFRNRKSWRTYKTRAAAHAALSRAAVTHG